MDEKYARMTKPELIAAINSNTLDGANLSRATLDGANLSRATLRCFWDTVDVFEKRVQGQKGDDALYLLTLPLLRAWAKIEIAEHTELSSNTK